MAEGLLLLLFFFKGNGIPSPSYYDATPSVQIIAPFFNIVLLLLILSSKPRSPCIAPRKVLQKKEGEASPLAPLRSPLLRTQQEGCSVGTTVVASSPARRGI